MGDFLLQFDKIHASKFKNTWGLFIHILIVVGCLAVFCLPYLDQLNVWLFLMFVGVSHYIQDWAKIKFTTRSKHGLLFFLLDQILHILFISALFLTDLKNIGTPLNKDGSVLLELYNNDPIILYVIVLISVSYMGHYIILLFKKDYLKIETGISVFEKRYGFMERIIIVSTFIAGQSWFVLIPLILALRPVLFKTLGDKLSVSDRFASWTEVILSGTTGILTGLIFCIFI